MRIEGDRVLEVGSAAVPAGAEDLGDAVLLPRLVNAHTHLEFSDLPEPIGGAGIALHDWIGKLILARQTRSPESQRLAIEAGTREVFESGARLVGDIATPPSDCTDGFPGLEIISFAEVLGLDPARAAERLEAAVTYSQTYPTAGFSPHAPYSTTLATVSRCLDYARRFDRPLAMHVAESPAERELLELGQGPFAESLRQLAVWRDGIFPWGDQPLLTLIDLLAQAPRALLVHGNYLSDDEIARLSKHQNLTVVYCPRTHHFFRHDRHPVDRMLAAGVRMALGTDSRASNPDLNLWSEVQYLLNQRIDIAPVDVLKMATIGGADALGYQDIGRIAIGCRPGLGYVATTATTAEGVYEELATGIYLPIRGV